MSPRLDVAVRVRLGGFDLDVAVASDAATVGLFGASGSGKTTVLEAVAGLRRGASGRIAFGGETWLDSARGIDRAPEARGVGYVPQDALLFPHWSARRNLLAGVARARRDGSPRLDPAHVAEVLDLGPLLERDVATLSGGERRRVALARALCSGPRLLLLDEPLAALDRPLRGRVLTYLLRVRDEFRIPTLYVSHEPAEVTALCDEVVVLRGGRVVASGPPAAVLTGATGVPGLARDDYENVLEGEIVETDGTQATVAIGGGLRLLLADAAGAPAGARVLVGLRADELMIAVAETPGLSARNVLAGAIRGLSGASGGWMVIVALDGGGPPLAALITEPARRALGLAPGVAVRLVAKARSSRLLALR